MYIIYIFNNCQDQTIDMTLKTDLEKSPPFFFFGGSFFFNFLTANLSDLLKGKLVLKLILYSKVNGPGLLFDYMFTYGKNTSKY